MDALPFFLLGLLGVVAVPPEWPWYRRVAVAALIGIVIVTLAEID